MVQFNRYAYLLLLLVSTQTLFAVPMMSGEMTLEEEQASQAETKQAAEVKANQPEQVKLEPPEKAQVHIVSLSLDPLARSISMIVACVRSNWKKGRTSRQSSRPSRRKMSNTPTTTYVTRKSS